MWFESQLIRQGAIYLSPIRVNLYRIAMLFRDTRWTQNSYEK